MTQQASIYGIPAEPLPYDCIAVDAVTVIKALNSAGEPVVFCKATGRLTAYEALGMLELARSRLLHGLEREESW